MKKSIIAFVFMMAAPFVDGMAGCALMCRRLCPQVELTKELLFSSMVLAMHRNGHEVERYKLQIPLKSLLGTRNVAGLLRHAVCREDLQTVLKKAVCRFNDEIKADCLALTIALSEESTSHDTRDNKAEVLLLSLPSQREDLGTMLKLMRDEATQDLLERMKKHGGRDPHIILFDILPRELVGEMIKRCPVKESPDLLAEIEHLLR